MRLYRWMIPLAALALALSLGSCNLLGKVLGGEASLAANPTSVTVGLAGSGSPLYKTVNVIAKDASQNQEGFSASSDDDAIATISHQTSSSFRVDAVAAGSTTISITSNSGKSLSIDVTVVGLIALTTPTGLTVSNPTSNSLDLAWTAGTGGADSYNVERSTSASTGYATIASGVTDTVFTDDTGLSASTKYYYKVQAARSSDHSTSSWSTSANGTTSALAVQTNPPAVPTGLLVQAPTSSTIPLKWNTASDAYTWDVGTSTSPNGPWTTIGTALTSTTFTANSLAASTTYYFAVRATNNAGTSLWSAGVSGTTLAVQVVNTAPTAKPMLSIGNIYSSSIQIKWTGVTGATWYNVQKVTSTGGFLMTLASSLNGFDFTDFGLTSSTTYYYQVQAANMYGNGPWSDTLLATTSTVQTGLSAPTTPPSLTTGFIDSASVQLQWMSVQNATAYDIQYSSNNGTTWNGPVTAYNSTSFTVTGLSPSTTYYFRARAWNAMGYTSYGSQVMATTNAVSTAHNPPPAPMNFNVSQINSQPYLSWASSSGASGYNIYRLDPGYVNYFMIGSTDQYTNYYIDTSALIGGSSYNYKVVAWNSYGSSGDSSIGYYYAPYTGGGLSAPNVYSSYSYGKSYVEIDWYYVTNAISYSMEVSMDGLTGWTFYNSTSYSYLYYYGPTGMGMTGGTTYFFRVTAFDNNGNSAMSNVFSYTTPPDVTSTTNVNVQIN